MENQELKEANRKAIPMFILLVIAGAAAGGIMGFVIANMDCMDFQKILNVWQTYFQHLLHHG